MNVFVIKNQGCKESKKNEDFVRFLALNPRGLGPEQTEKITIAKSAIKECEIDRLLFSSPGRRWNQRRLEDLEVKFRRMRKEVKIIESDSGEDATKGI